MRAEARRQGAGTLLMREVLGLMHGLDKTILTLSTHTEPGHSFLTWVGATPKLTSVFSRAKLNELDWNALREWEDAASGLGLNWERYAGRVPREALLGLLPEITALFSDVPLGELEIPPIRVEIEVYDQWYGMLGRTGGAHHLILLRGYERSRLGRPQAKPREPAAYRRGPALAGAWPRQGVEGRDPAAGSPKPPRG